MLTKIYSDIVIQSQQAKNLQELSSYLKRDSKQFAGILKMVKVPKQSVLLVPEFLIQNKQLHLGYPFYISVDFSSYSSANPRINLNSKPFRLKAGSLASIFKQLKSFEKKQLALFPKEEIRFLAVNAMLDVDYYGYLPLSIALQTISEQVLACSSKANQKCWFTSAYKHLSKAMIGRPIKKLQCKAKRITSLIYGVSPSVAATETISFNYDKGRLKKLNYFSGGEEACEVSFKKGRSSRLKRKRVGSPCPVYIGKKPLLALSSYPFAQMKKCCQSTACSKKF